MKSLIQLKQPRSRSGLLIHLLIACVGLSPMALAVVPPPDGGYAGGNTAEGQNALLSLTGGTYNTAVGLFSLRSNTEGNFNTANGAGTLLLNTGDENTAFGAGALFAIPAEPTTRPMERSHSLATLPAAIRPLGQMRF
jgi:hypothetical protein